MNKLRLRKRRVKRKSRINQILVAVNKVQAVRIVLILKIHQVRHKIVIILSRVKRKGNRRRKKIMRVRRLMKKENNYQKNNK
jgi:hypothetical protein